MEHTVMVEKMRDMLANIDRDMANKLVSTPPRAMYEPLTSEDRTTVWTEEPQRKTNVADLTGDVLRKSAEDATQAVMKSVGEAEAKVAALREKAEGAMAQLKEWTEDFARQNTELIEKCIALESSINETVSHIIQIGQKPLGGNGSR